jgi:two-component system sporulation sensor kinase A
MKNAQFFSSYTISPEDMNIFFHLSTNLLAITNESGYFLDVNPAWEEMLGFTREELCAIPFIELVHIDDRKRTWDMFWQVINDEGTVSFENRCCSRDGSYRWLMWNVVLFPERKNIYINAQDITDKKRLEAQLEEKKNKLQESEERIRQIADSDKLRVVGELAAGIAHEIRNPLTSIKGFVQMLKEETDGKYSGIILSELQRIEFILNEFLILAKPNQDIHFQKKEVIPLIDEVIALLQAEAMLLNIEIVKEYNWDLPLIWCEEKQIKQVLINVIKNAFEAMERGGKVYIQTGVYDGNHIYIRIIDQGIGIPEDRISRLGEPFYSHKEKGTGLGLMVSFRIIENHKGKISIASEPGKGTTVDIILPISS